ncbi:Uncharacterised protein [Vibrio cholerae]|nr:Uncharacterised protein [Vibrio cholerae]
MLPLGPESHASILSLAIAVSHMPVSMCSS